MELQRIADKCKCKYKRKYNDRNSKCICIAAVVSAMVLLFSISLFAMIHVATNSKGTKAYKNHGNIKEKVPMHDAFQRKRSKYIPTLAYI